MRRVSLLGVGIGYVFSCLACLFAGAFLHWTLSRHGGADTTHERMYALYVADQAYYVRNGKLMDKLSDLAGIYFDTSPTQNYLDGWGTEFKYNRENRLLLSAGFDRKHGSEDDIVVELAELTN